MTDLAPSPAREGEIIAEKYRIEEVLGAGGFGLVVAARHLQLNDRVALKFLLPAARAKPEIVQRFLREARAAVKIKSEHVARVLDVGALPDGAPFMVMEYLAGCDLGQEIARRGSLPATEAVEVLLQACEAIAEAHSLGIIHRDLKPANLFRIDRPGGAFLIKVLDFGIAKLAEGEPSAEPIGLTTTSAVMGSPHYMAPEQLRSSRAADARSDIWSLGVILFLMLSGKLPFDADSLPGVIAMVFSEPAPSFRQLGAQVPPELEAVVRRCLDRNPDNRYESIRDLAEALAPHASLASRLSIARISMIQAFSSPSSPPSIPPGPLSRTQDPATSTASATRRTALGLGLATLAVLGLLGMAWRFAVLSGDAGQADAGPPASSWPAGALAASSGATETPLIPAKAAAPAASASPMISAAPAASGSLASPVISAALAASAPALLASAAPAGEGANKGTTRVSVGGQVRSPESPRTPSAPAGAPTVDRTVDSRH